MLHTYALTYTVVNSGFASYSKQKTKNIVLKINANYPIPHPFHRHIQKFGKTSYNQDKQGPLATHMRATLSKWKINGSIQSIN